MEYTLAPTAFDLAGRPIHTRQVENRAYQATFNNMSTSTTEGLSKLYQYTSHFNIFLKDLRWGAVRMNSLRCPHRKPRLAVLLLRLTFRSFPLRNLNHPILL